MTKVYIAYSGLTGYYMLKREMINEADCEVELNEEMVQLIERVQELWVTVQKILSRLRSRSIDI